MKFHQKYMFRTGSHSVLRRTDACESSDIISLFDAYRNLAAHAG